MNNPVVTFTPGTYNDVTAFNTLMGGGCANHVFYFPSGVYYFDFANAVGGHEWTINDGTARVVGGQPNGTPVGAITVGPTTWKPSTTANVAGSVNFTNPANATSIDGVAATVPALAAGQTARITLSGYATAPASTIPANATIDSVRLRVAHNEATPANVGTPTVTITSQGSPACAAVNITKRAALGEDAAPSYDVTGCLNSPTKLNSPVSLVYAVPGTATSAIGLDGIWLDVTYTTATRPAWDPTNPATVNAGSPAVPGSCRRDGDAGWTDGVQFVFGGDSHINLKSGAFELCDKPSSTQQEIVLYGVKSASGGGTVVGPWAWIAQNFTNGASGFTNPTNGRVVDGTPATAEVTSAIPNRTMTLTQFSPTTWPIPGVDQIPANATNIQASLAVTHWESNTSQTNNPQIAVTPSGAGACATQTLSEHLVGDANKTDTVDVSSCLNTPSKLNGGLSVLFTARRSSSSPTENLDGMALSVTYTVPSGGGGGGLTPESGCVVQKPYYSTVDHSPAFNGACALFRVSSNSAGGASPRTVAFWGTVYAPSAALDIQVDVLTVPVFNRGVVARMLMLGYNVQLPQLVPITTTPVVDVQHRNRRMTFTATIAGRSTKAVADVEFCDVSCAAPDVGCEPADQDLFVEGVPVSVYVRPTVTSPETGRGWSNADDDHAQRRAGHQRKCSTGHRQGGREARQTGGNKLIQKSMAKKRSGEGGFTLVELLIVIVILGILAAIVVLAIGGLSGTAKKSACNSGIKTIESAEDAYYASPDPVTGDALSTYGDIPALLTGTAGKLLKTDPTAKLVVVNPTANGYTINGVAGSDCAGITKNEP